MTIHVGAGRGPGHLNRLATGGTVSAPAPVAGDVVAAAVRDATALNAVNGDGWTVDLTFKGMAAGGTVDLGSGPMAVTLNRGGFDGAGAATTYAETINGTVALRKPAPNDTQFAQATSGPDVRVTVALDRRVLATDALSSATIGAGAYNDGALASRATTLAQAALTNASTRASPIPLYGFLMPQHMRATGASFHVEAVVLHAYARFGRQVACVEFRVRDIATSTDQGISVKVNDTSLSTFLTQGPKVECFAADIPLSSLAQTGVYEVYMLIYPWIGGAVFDTRTAGQVSGSNAKANQKGLRFLCDKTGAYGDLVAYVKTGVSGGAIGSAATPFPTIYAAAMALRTANTAKASPNAHTNVGGSTIYLMEDSLGAGGTHYGFGNDMNVPAYDGGNTKTWWTVTVDPAATGVVNFATGGDKGMGDMLKLQGAPKFKLLKATAVGNDNDFGIIDGFGAAGRIWMTGFNLTIGWSPPSNVPYFYRFAGAGAVVYVTNNTFGAASDPYGANFGLFAGNVYTGAPYGQPNRPHMVVGNDVPFTWEVGPAAGVADLSDNAIVGWNKAMKQTITFALNGANGVAYVSNLWEFIGLPGNQIAADNANFDQVNMVEWHNTIAGDRANRMYTSSGIAADGRIKEGVRGHCISRYHNVKSDYFYVVSEGGASGAGRTGNWPYRFGVDNRNNLAHDGDNTGNTSWGKATWLGEVKPRGDKSPSTGAVFVDDKSAKNYDSGGGDYHLTGSSNDAFNMVPAGEGVFKYDLDGNLRRQDGTGAAGAYERP